MSHAFYSDAAEKIRAELTRSEQVAVESVRRTLEDDPGPAHARGLPDADPQSESYVIELLPEQTGGRGISVVYRYSQTLDSALIVWLIAGP
ncbi:hypothetical protein PV735_46860 [Streptomyces turgidiscabies]|uniref:DUF4258 domain-containing protein n=1 Tax=Streptomyces turgidiscabies (strain Car8) TaxID=698760 RepID=L7FF72_STRT8|nr:hypothetical protein [Streptomyces turgidiscabies]ELP69957.1 hypothetical protein STRTUCAR8_00013 [Streptomyces turgidiscabies Car8]MDX3500142.1 hypothetical protein [Streptomyces turgidiscabies]GAQ77174.1 hypothetical protein T45_08990 [Streptomyces turgidiscabies]